MTISEAEGLNALQKKAPDLLKYQELKNVLLNYLNIYGKGSYYQISNIFTGYKPALGIEVHHLVEQRLYNGGITWLERNLSKIGVNTVGSIPSMAMTITEHQTVSTLLERYVPKGAGYAIEYAESRGGKELVRQGYEKAYTEINRKDIYNYLFNLGIFN